MAKKPPFEVFTIKVGEKELPFLFSSWKLAFDSLTLTYSKTEVPRDAQVVSRWVYQSVEHM